ncbi:MAG: DUF4956 domain-containing protein [Vicinamibacterales bacterium]|nr:DUF4956 domain-containing protein [Vicinamibacterales bacterium]
MLAHGPDLLSLLSRLGLDLAFALVTSGLVYFRLYGRRDYAFTYVVLNVVTFMLALLLSSVPVELGFALGLFGVFGILRYRTEAIQVRELTYLFVFIGYALVNSVAGMSSGLPTLAVANATLLATVSLLEWAGFSRREEARHVRYDRLDLLSRESEAALLEDLRARTHMPVERFDIGQVDLLRDTADITVYFHPTR